MVQFHVRASEKNYSDIFAGDTGCQLPLKLQGYSRFIKKSETSSARRRISGHNQRTCSSRLGKEIMTGSKGRSLVRAWRRDGLSLQNNRVRSSSQLRRWTNR